MAFWDFLRRPVSNAHFTPNISFIGGEEIVGLLGDETPTTMWESQPHLRTVVSFLARNIAQLGLHAFERDGDDRVRDRTSAVATALGRPNDLQTAYELIYALVGDLSLYDRAYWLIEDDGEKFGLRRLPPTWVSPQWSNAFTIEKYVVATRGGNTVDVSPDAILSFTGYNPGSLRCGSPTIEALKGTLNEQIEAAKYRSQVWKNGGRASAVLQRPVGAPEWSGEASERFRADWHDSYTGNGPKAGGTPLLEDGMTLNRIDFSAQEQQFVEAAKLSFSTVASAFHVNPTMVGILDNANYSNVREFRSMLYGDTLGPLIAQIEDRINTFLLPKLGMDPATHYVEFNIAEKLQGSFEEQAAVMSTLVGRPIMTGDEGRAKFNLSSLGGDMASVVVPLNVLIGGQASPTDTGSQNVTGTSSAETPQLKAGGRANETFEERHREVLSAFFKRQQKVVQTALGVKAAGDWWDSARWDRELSDDLLKLNLNTSTEAATSALLSAGFTREDYDKGRTEKFLRANADRVAGLMNAATKDQLDVALNSDDPSAGINGVFDDAAGFRAEQAATTTVTFASAFGLSESGSQVSPGRATKTWRTTSRNPRKSHSAMNGKTVPIGSKFPNGADWPADSQNLDVDEVAGCKCAVEISY